MLNLLHLKRQALCVTLVASFIGPAIGANFRTRNFIATASTADLAKEIGERAEMCREQFARDWFGIELPPWDDPCLISATVGERLPVRGGMSYVFDRERPTQWEMQVQGPRSAILRSVVPHEVTHIVFATRLGRRLPRWLEEGACVCAEHRHDRGDLESLLSNQPDLGKPIALEQMFTLSEVPADALPLYAQCYSFVSFLIAHGGKRRFAQFLANGADHANWAVAARTHYGHATLQELEQAWLRWSVLALPQAPTLVAQASE